MIDTIGLGQLPPTISEQMGFIDDSQIKNQESLENIRFPREILDTHSSIRTVSGLYIDVLNPDPDSIIIEDIAHALSMQCRWGGQIKQFFSIAQHCVEAVSLVKRYDRFAMLMHDASEAYLCDIPSPIKKHLTNYKEIEHNLMQVIATKFNFEYPLNDKIHLADRQMLEAEWYQLVLNKEVTGTMYKLNPLPQKESYNLFMKEFEKYYDEWNRDFDKKSIVN